MESWDVQALMKDKVLLYVVNADWYFKLHWLNRAMANIANGYKVVVISCFDTPGLSSELEKQGIECHHIKMSRSGINPFFEFITLYAILKLARKIKPDIIHSITVKPNIYSGIIGRIIRRPVVKSVTGLGVIFSNESFFFRTIRPIVTNLYKIAGSSRHGAFVFENNHDLIFFKRNNITDSQSLYFVEGAGVDPKRFYRAHNAFEQEKKNILFAARLLKDKGLDTLLVALDQLYIVRQDFVLNIAGIYDLDARNAYTPDEIEHISQREYVNWLGHRTDMENVLSGADLVVLPTRYGEGIPRILIEAAFCGIPILTTDVQGCNEFIENNVNGYLITPGNATELATMLAHIFDNTHEALLFAERLYEKVHYDYSDEAIINKFSAIYRTLHDEIGS
ncbi:glycosyltransferase family 4 protein [Kosakonia sacchari]|uniref:glycosyltransferase family 4 protein n=1 Tax=Kosakonia TaxID=1330547 RepID=UPI00190A818A|nr:glycosyltransferase family 4 protein [Kosakonia sp. LAM2021]